MYIDTHIKKRKKMKSTSSYQQQQMATIKTGKDLLNCNYKLLLLLITWHTQKSELHCSKQHFFFEYYYEFMKLWIKFQLWITCIWWDELISIDTLMWSTAINEKHLFFFFLSLNLFSLVIMIIITFKLYILY